MMNQKRQFKNKKEAGLATIEIVPLLFIFVLILAYTMGAFGIIHSGIKQSISARVYVFEVAKSRSDLTYFRDTAGGAVHQYRQRGNRIFAITSEQNRTSDIGFAATERPIRIGIAAETTSSRNDKELHNIKIFDSNKIGPGKRNQEFEVSPAWIMVQYGICLNNTCGD